MHVYLNGEDMGIAATNIPRVQNIPFFLIILAYTNLQLLY